MADDAGALLVRTGLIDDQALLSARKACAAGGGTLGEQLVLLGAVGDEALTEFYRSRLLVPRVNPNTLARLAANVVQSIPGELAIEFRAVPVALDREGNLTVAMSDPSDRHAVDELGFFTGKYVVRAVATQMQVAWCLAHYYGHITELGRRLLKKQDGTTPAASPSPVPEKVPRVRGFTGRVDAARHKVMPPVAGTLPTDARPSDKLLTPTAADLAKIKDESENAPQEVPAEPSEPYAIVTVEAAPPPPKGVRRKPAEPDPPELAARGGEIEGKDKGVPLGTVDAELPAVVVSLDDELGAPAGEVEIRPIDDEPGGPEDEEEFDEAEWAARRDTAERATTEPDPDVEPAVIHDTLDTGESAPILLTAAKRPAPRDTVPETDDDEDSPPVLLERKAAGKKNRIGRQTQVGLGLPAVTPRPASVPPAASSDTSQPPSFPASQPPKRPWSVATPADGVPRVLEDGVSDAKTRPHMVTPPPHNVDDDWGPPGTTIPPPFLGAMPGTEPSRTTGSQIPIPDADDDDDAAPPLLVATPPTPAPTPAKGTPTAPAPDPVAVARELERASTRLVDLLRALDRAQSRDEVVDTLLGYLTETHHRAAFIALKNGVLTPFHQRPPAKAAAPELKLGTPSTLQDVVGTRLPYRGAVADDPTRRFLEAAFGVAPSDVVLLPMAVRERVVAVLVAEGRKGQTFDDHFAVAGRAAGQALERILQARRAGTQ